MNTEDYVTYEQAVKLKELGFDWECSNNSVKYVGVETPTLAQAQKWLREVKKIIVIPCVMYVKDILKYDFYIDGDPLDVEYDFEGFDTYEQALSAGIDRALELLTDKTEKEMKEHKTFNAYDKVLVRVCAAKRWKCDFYSHYVQDNEYPHRTLCYHMKDENILPYEGNEHLVSTTDEPEEVVELKEGEYIMVCGEPSVSQYRWTLRRFAGIHESPESFTACAQDNTIFRWNYAIRFSDFNPEDMEETKRHILCVKNGKVVRYKSE